MRKFFKLFRILFEAVYAKFDHTGYAKYKGVTFGENFHIYGNPYSMFGTEPWCIKFGNNVHITRDVMFITHDGGTLLFRDRIPDLEITKSIIAGDNVYIGARSMIMPGVRIGNNVIIAAGSIVTKDIPNNSVYGGCPAKFIKPISDYFEKIQQESLHLGHLKGKAKDVELRKVIIFE